MERLWVGRRGQEGGDEGTERWRKRKGGGFWSLGVVKRAYGVGRGFASYEYCFVCKSATVGLFSVDGGDGTQLCWNGDGVVMKAVQRVGGATERWQKGCGIWRKFMVMVEL